MPQVAVANYAQRRTTGTVHARLLSDHKRSYAAVNLYTFVHTSAKCRSPLNKTSIDFGKRYIAAYRCRAVDSSNLSGGSIYRKIPPSDSFPSAHAWLD